MQCKLFLTSGTSSSSEPLSPAIAAINSPNIVLDLDGAKDAPGGKKAAECTQLHLYVDQQISAAYGRAKAIVEFEGR